MYNQYIPQDKFCPIPSQNPTPERESPAANSGSSPFSFLSSLLGRGKQTEEHTGKNAGLSGILDRFGLGHLDHSDLLLFILIYLFRESEDDERLIILALVLLMGL